MTEPTEPAGRIPAQWTTVHTVITEDVVPGMRLGRNVRHDSRSLAYRYQAPAEVTLASASWTRHIPILDQGNVGSCTGNALTGALGCDPLNAGLPAGHPALDEAEALRIYSEAETIDGDGPYPPNDNGSSGLSVAQAAKADGLVSGYTHCLSLADVQAALMAGPVLLGLNWYSSFDRPASSGLVAISKGAYVRGGHEVLARSLDTDNKLIGIDNSWGTGWGVNGSFTMSWATLDRLLHEQGDGTVPVPVAAPAPVPAPPVPESADTEFAAAARAWLTAKGL